MLEILDSSSPACKSAIEAFGKRLERLETLESAAAREKTKKTFGREMTPVEVVRTILNDVRDEGDAALFRYCELLDGVKIGSENIRVPPEEIQAAPDKLDPDLLDAMRLAAKNIRAYQERILPPPVPVEENEGINLGLKVTPVDRVGVYVPGGLAAYPSSVLMSVIPAQAAGVKSVCVATPPTRAEDGSAAVNAAVLGAAAICGIDEVYRAGGVQAVGALAYGTASVPKVDFIAGPGNLFVMLAKKEVFGRVQVDMLAGPSEVLIIADETAEPAWIAADMLSQAEHDPMASAVLLTTSRELALKVRSELAIQLEALPRRAIAAEALESYGVIIVCRDENEMVRMANEYAPEHCEVFTREPKRTAGGLLHAGALFLGSSTPEPVGDYVAGPSHTLPTGGTARFFSGLSSLSFLKTTSLIEATPEGHARVCDAVETLARAESLIAHERSSSIRFRGGK